MTKFFIYAKTGGMTRKSRKIFFWLAVLIFFVLAPIIVSYAQGYRFDFSRGEIVQVGGMIIESNPEEAEVWLGEKKLKIKSPFAIPSLLPFRFYNIRVEKEGFSSWEKNLLVRPEKITPARTIVLFPNELALEKRLDIRDIKNFYVSPNTEKVLVQTENNILNVINIKNRRNLPMIINLKDGLKTFGIDDVRWSDNSKYLVFSRKIWTGSVWYFFNTSSGKLINLTQLYEKQLVISSPSKTPLPRNFNSNNLTFLNEDSKIISIIDGKLFLIDPIKETLEDLHVVNVNHLANFGKRLLIIKSPDALIEVNEKGENKAIYGNTTFAPLNISISPDGKKLAFMHEYSVGVMWLEDINGGQLRKKSDQEIIYQSPHIIEKFWWHAGSEYIIVMLSNGNLVTMELDGRGGKRNGATWQLENAINFSYSQKEKSLWVLSDDSLLEYSKEF